MNDVRGEGLSRCGKRMEGRKRECSIDIGRESSRIVKERNP